MKSQHWLGLAAILLSACSGTASDTGTSFPAQALEHLTSAGGAYGIDVRTSPTQPPSAGVLAVELRIVDRAGGPADGLTIDAVPAMPAHGHGASVHPTVTARGGGVYVLENVSLYMPGAWELQTTFQGSIHDVATIPLDVH
jgi:hypothetical protein